MVLLLGEIGVILLLLQVGLEMDLGELAKVGKPALFVALIGVAVPFAAGFGVASAFGEEGKIALFIGVIERLGLIHAELKIDSNQGGTTIQIKF